MPKALFEDKNRILVFQGEVVEYKVPGAKPSEGVVSTTIYKSGQLKVKLYDPSLRNRSIIVLPSDCELLGLRDRLSTSCMSWEEMKVFLSEAKYY